MACFQYSAALSNIVRAVSKSFFSEIISYFTKTFQIFGGFASLSKIAHENLKKYFVCVQMNKYLTGEMKKKVYQFKNASN